MAAQGTRAFEDEFNGQNCEGLHPGEQEVSNYMRIVQPENEEGRSAQTQYRSGSQAAEGSASGYEANSEMDDEESWAKTPSDLLMALRNG